MKARIFLMALAAVALLGTTTLRADDIELKCPLSGKAVNAEQTADFNGGTVAFCCKNCKAAFAKAPEKFAAKANLQLVQSKQLKQVACPLTAKPIAAGKVVEVEGVKVGVCCPGCLAKAKKLSGDDLIALLFTTGKGFEPASE
jgi:YHS domain-containing protein